ncbi:MAG: AEC family transporter [Candidatus Saccharibacteria bacterium]
MKEIISIVLPIFLVIGAGFLMRRYRLVKEDWVPILNSFVYYVSLPAVILISFWQISWQRILPLLGINVLGMLAFAAILIFALYFAKISPKTKSALFMAALVGNTIYMGFPIIGNALGRESTDAVVGAATLQLVLGLVLSVMAVEFWVVKTRSFRVYALDFLKNPLIISLAAGILLSFVKQTGTAVAIIQKPISMLGATASPLALFALGAFMHGKFIRTHLGLSLMSSTIKLLFFPLFMMPLAWVFYRPVDDVVVTLLVSSMPVAATAFVIAEKYRLDEKLIANAILISTLISIFTISGFLALAIY